MFLDASAVVAILNREDGAADLDRRLQGSTEPLYYSDIVLFEATQAVARVRAFMQSMTLRQRPEILAEALDEVMAFLDALGAVYVSVTIDIGKEAINASRTYGKVVGHRAALNLGDCYSYACAKFLQVPLLYKGQDFAATDLA